MNREYIKLSNNRYLVKNSCGIIVSEKEMLEEQNKEAKNGDTKSNTKQKAKSAEESDNSAEHK